MKRSFRRRMVMTSEDSASRRAFRTAWFVVEEEQREREREREREGEGERERERGRGRGREREVCSKSETERR